MCFLSLKSRSFLAHVFIFTNSTFISSQLWLLCIVYLENCVCLISALVFKKQGGDNDIRVFGQEHVQWNFSQA